MTFYLYLKKVISENKIGKEKENFCWYLEGR